MPKPPQRSAQAKTLVRLYTKLRQGYEQHKRCRISRLKRLYRLLGIPSTGHLSLSSLSSESTQSSLSATTDSEDEGTTSEDSWAKVLASDWQGQGILGSDTSLASNDSDILSQGDHNSDSSSTSSSGYSGDAESSFKSDGLEVSDDEDAEEFTGDRWA